VPRTLRWVLIAIAVLIALYVIGFLVFGVGGGSPGPV
jgi:hypothetical protein